MLGLISNSSQGIDCVFFGCPILFKNMFIWQWSDGECTNEGVVHVSDGIIGYTSSKN